MRSIGRIILAPAAGALLLGSFHTAQAGERHAAGGIAVTGIDAARERHAAGGLAVIPADAARERHAAGAVMDTRAPGTRAEASSHAVDLNRPFTK